MHCLLYHYLLITERYHDLIYPSKDAQYRYSYDRFNFLNDLLCMWNIDSFNSACALCKSKHNIIFLIVIVLTTNILYGRYSSRSVNKRDTRTFFILWLTINVHISVILILFRYVFYTLLSLNIAPHCVSSTYFVHYLLVIEKEIHCFFILLFKSRYLFIANLKHETLKFNFDHSHRYSCFVLCKLLIIKIRLVFKKLFDVFIL